MGYPQHHGGRWSGDYYVLDAEVLADSNNVRGLHPKRYRDIVVPNVITFPVAAGMIKQPDEGVTEPLGIEDEEEEGPPALEDSSDDENVGGPSGHQDHASDADS